MAVQSGHPLTQDPLAHALQLNTESKYAGRKPTAKADVYYSPANTKRGQAYPDGWRTIIPLALDVQAGLLWAVHDIRDTAPRAYRVSGIMETRERA